MGGRHLCRYILVVLRTGSFAVFVRDIYCRQEWSGAGKSCWKMDPQPGESRGLANEPAVPIANAAADSEGMADRSGNTTAGASGVGPGVIGSLGDASSRNVEALADTCKYITTIVGNLQKSMPTLGSEEKHCVEQLQSQLRGMILGSTQVEAGGVDGWIGGGGVLPGPSTSRVRPEVAVSSGNGSVPGQHVGCLPLQELPGVRKRRDSSSDDSEAAVYAREDRRRRGGIHS